MNLTSDLYRVIPESEWEETIWEGSTEILYDENRGLVAVPVTIDYEAATAKAEEQEPWAGGPDAALRRTL
jgi:hypothetical protein